MFNNKKGAEWVITVIVIFVIVLVAGYFVINYFRTGSGKGFGVISTQLGALDDYDDDKTANMFDKCPCTPVGTIEDSKLGGCPRGTTAERSQEDKKLFKEEKCAEITPIAGEAEVGSTTFKLFEGNTPISSGSTYHPQGSSIKYEATCASKCEIKIKYPASGDFRSLVAFEEGNQEQNEVSLPDVGTYVLILSEGNQEKTRYLIEKQE